MQSAEMMSSISAPAALSTSKPSPFLAMLPAVPPPKTVSVSLAWDPSPDASVTGYRLYYGVNSATYTNSMTVGNVTNATITGLKDQQIYFFAATAFDASGLESDFSNEASFSPPPTLTIKVDRFAITSPGVLGATNDLFEAHDLNSPTWSLVLTFVGNGSPVTYLTTNAPQGSFFKLVPRN